MHKKIIVPIALGLLLCSGAQAETATQTLSVVPFNTDISVDFGSGLIGITSVTLSATGQSGAIVQCDHWMGEVVTVHYSWILGAYLADVGFWDGAGIGTMGPFTWNAMGGMYDVDPDFLASGSAAFRIEFMYPEEPLPGWSCVTNVDPVIEELTITVEYESAVSAERTTFDTIKAYYR